MAAWAGIAVIGLLTAITAAPHEDARPVAGRPDRAPETAAAAPVWSPLVEARPPMTFENRHDPRPLHYESRQQADTGAREDAVGLGTLADDTSVLVALIRSEVPPPASPFLDLARRAATRGLTLSRMSVVAAARTKFGPVEVADATLTRDGRARSCQMFRFRHDVLDIGLAGWMCGEAADEPRARLVCLIDRLVLVEPADLTLGAIFAAANERRSPACGGRVAIVKEVESQTAEIDSKAARRRGPRAAIRSSVRAAL